MHGQGNYTQFGQGPYASQPPFQQHPLAHPPPPPPFQQGHLASIPQVLEQGALSFPPPSGLPAYPHTPPGPPQQGLCMPVLSNLVNTSQSYSAHLPPTPPPPRGDGSTQMSHSCTTSMQHLQWGQNVHQIPQMAPLSAPSAFPPVPSHGHMMGRVPGHLPPPQHAPLPPHPPPYPLKPSFLAPDPFGSSVHSVPQHSHISSVGLLSPPPPPPPTSPPALPPLPPALPLTVDNVSMNDGSSSLNGDLPSGDSLIMEFPPPVKLVEDKIVQNEVLRQSMYKRSSEAEVMDSVVAYSPSDSDMDMEDDITQPDEHQANYSMNNLNNESFSIANEVDGEEKLQVSQLPGGDGLPNIAVDESLCCSGPLVSKEQKIGSGILSNHDLPDTRKSSEVDDSDITLNEDTECPPNVNVEKSSSSKENFSQPNAPVASAEAGMKFSSRLIEGPSPFRLLQGYASDDSVENVGKIHIGNVSTIAASPSIKDGFTNYDSGKGCNFGSELSPESTPEASKMFAPSSLLVPAKSSIISPRVVMEAGSTSFATQEAEEFADRRHRNEKSVKDGVKDGTSQETLLPKDSLPNFGVDAGHDSGILQKPDTKSSSTKLNVDEFGRLAREQTSDSDTSDSPRYTQRHLRRGRNRSRSHSPHDRRRRSPLRRKERRDRSRSLSPKRRRSRSRSPGLRRSNEFGGYKQRRVKGQLPECFDFVRGKCYRGASCRYSHHESDKSDRLRYNTGKLQNQDIIPASKSSDVFVVGKESLGDPVTYVAEVNSVGSPTDLVTDGIARNLSVDSAHDDMHSGIENSLIKLPPGHNSDKGLQTAVKQPQQMDNNLISDSSSSPIRASETIQRQLSFDKPSAKQHSVIQLHSVRSPMTKPYLTEQVLSHSLDPMELSPPNHTQLPPSLPSVSEVANIPAQHISRDSNLMPPIAQFHSKPENFPIYQASMRHQHFHFPIPSQSSSSLLAPPHIPVHGDSTVNVTLGKGGFPSQQLQQSLLPPQNCFSYYTSTRPYRTEPTSSQIGQHWTYSSVLEPDQVSHPTDDFRSRDLSVSNLMSQPHGHPNVIGEVRFSGHPEQGLYPFHSFVQPIPFSKQSPSKGMQTFLGESLLLSSTSQSHNFLQQPSYGQQYPATDGRSAQLSDPGEVRSSTSRLTQDILERNQPSFVPDFVGSRISNHFNPYAATFDQPPTSKFCLNHVYQEKDKYCAPFGLSSGPVDGHDIGSLGSRNTASTSHSVPAAEGNFLRPGGDQYDPLFDSIEPSLNSFRKDHHRKDVATDGSGFMLIYNGPGKAVGVEENKNLQGVGSVSTYASVENDEFGETADAEVGAVENGSPSNPNDATDVAAGDIEIDQIKTSGKKKGKDSRSMKLFKIAIADFVKEVLKPSWRQGNMSKEAFKTIVKKTVDKVSGAMKSHRIPKSEAKINHYIDSLQGKLTKLVMGYVDKYVKV